MEFNCDYVAETGVAGCTNDCCVRDIRDATLRQGTELRGQCDQWETPTKTGAGCIGQVSRCFVIHNREACGQCTDSVHDNMGTFAQERPCTSSGSRLSETDRADNANITVGFGSDVSDMRFGDRDWTAKEREWCGAKLFQEDTSGFFGLTTGAIIVVAIAALTSSWDTITEVEAGKTWVAAVISLGAIFDGILEVLLFAWYPLYIAMTVYVGDFTKAESNGVSPAAAATSFLNLEYASSTDTYRIVTYAAITLQVLIPMHASAVLSIHRDRIALVTALLKTIVVVVCASITWGPALALMQDIHQVESDAVRYKEKLAQGEAILRDSIVDTTQLLDWMKNLETAAIRPVGYSGDAGASVGVVLYVSALVLSLIDEAEVVVVRKLRKKSQAQPAAMRADESPMESPAVKV